MKGLKSTCIINTLLFGMILEKIIPYHVHTSHKKHSPKVWFETEHFEILSFLGMGLKVPAATYVQRIDPIKKLLRILKIWKF